MNDDILLETVCPSCQQPMTLPGSGSEAACPSCSYQFRLPGHLCPVCSVFHPDETPFCAECGTDMVRTCRRCRTVNWTGYEQCSQCGQTLDIFEYLQIKGTASTADRLNEQMAWSRDIKQKEKEAADRRMQELMDVEAERQNKLQALQARQKKNDKMLFLFGVLGLIVLVLSIAAIIAFQALS